MNCRDVQNSREAYEAGSMDAAELRAYVEHLEGCEACSEALRDFSSLFTELPEEPFSLEETIMNEVQKAAAPRQKPAWFALFLRPAFGAGVAAGLVMLFLLSSLFRGPKTPSLANGEVASQNQTERILLADSRLVLREGAVMVNGKRWDASDKGANAIDLYGDDHVVTEAGAKGALELGVAVLTLRENLDFTVHPNMLALKKGTTYVHLRRQGTEFKVTTPLLICAVRGTTFKASHDEAGSVIDLVESVCDVTVSLPDGFAMPLADGESASVSSEGETSTSVMTENQLLETVQGAAEGLGETVKDLGKKILSALKASGKSSGRIIDFFDRVVSGALAGSSSRSDGSEASSATAGSADMWKNH